jgi:hypothetical protein
MDAVKSPYLFPSPDDPTKPVVKLNNAHYGALERSELKRFRLYDLRHTWAFVRHGRAIDCNHESIITCESCRLSISPIFLIFLGDQHSASGWSSGFASVINLQLCLGILRNSFALDSLYGLPSPPAWAYVSR